MCDDNGVHGAVLVQRLAGRVFAEYAGISK